MHAEKVREFYRRQGVLLERERILKLIQETISHDKDDCVRCNIIKEITKGTWFPSEEGSK